MRLESFAEISVLYDVCTLAPYNFSTFLLRLLLKNPPLDVPHQLVLSACAPAETCFYARFSTSALNQHMQSSASTG